MFSQLHLMACSESQDTCLELLTTQTAPSHYVWRETYGNYYFVLVIYQGDEEVQRGRFEETDKTGICFVNDILTYAYEQKKMMIIKLDMVVFIS